MATKREASPPSSPRPALRIRTTSPRSSTPKPGSPNSSPTFVGSPSPTPTSRVRFSLPNSPCYAPVCAAPDAFCEFGDPSSAISIDPTFNEVIHRFPVIYGPRLEADAVLQNFKLFHFQPGPGPVPYPLRHKSACDLVAFVRTHRATILERAGRPTYPPVLPPRGHSFYRFVHGTLDAERQSTDAYLHNALDFLLAFVDHVLPFFQPF